MGQGRRKYIAIGIAVVSATSLVALGTANASTTPTSHTISVNVSADTYVAQNEPATNFGSESKLVAESASGDQKITFLKFNVGGIPAGSKVSAKLAIERDDHHFPATTVDVLSAPNNWSETSLTWNNRPGLGNQVSSARVNSSMSLVTFDVSKVVTGNGTFSLALKSPVTNDVVRFAPKEFDSSRPAPKLQVTYTAGTTTTTAKPTTTIVKLTTTTAKPSVSTTVAPVSGSGGKLTIGAHTFDSSGNDTIAGFEQQNSLIGPLKVRRSFTSGIPSSIDQSSAKGDVANGVIPFVSIKPPGNDIQGVINGKYDAQITAWAKTLPTSGLVYATMYHEPEGDMNGATYVALQRHVSPVVKKANPNVRYGQIYGSYRWQIGTSHYSGPMANWYPGDNYSDFVAIDTYDQTPTPLTQDPQFMGWYSQFKNVNKPMFITEYGQYEYHGSPDPAMLQKEASVINQDYAWIKTTKISMWLNWDSGVPANQGTQDWRLQGPAASAWKAIAQANK